MRCVFIYSMNLTPYCFKKISFQIPRKLVYASPATVPLRFIVLFLLTGFLWSPATASFSVNSATPTAGVGGSAGADCTILPMTLFDLSLRDFTHSCCKTRSKVNLNVMSGSRMCRTIDFALADI